MHLRTLLFLSLAALLISQCSAEGKKKKMRVRKQMPAEDEPEKKPRRKEDRSDRTSSESKERSESASWKKLPRRESRSFSDESEKKPEYIIRHAPSTKYYLEQSPIHINAMTRAVGFDRLLKPLKFSYQPSENYVLKNTGHGFIVKFPDHKNFVAGGPLDQPYYLANMQIRWGTKNRLGSEHRVNGRAYAGEVQLVHYNKLKYGTYDEASKHGDGLAVVSVFLKLTYKPSHPLYIISKFLNKIQKAKGMKLKLHNTLSLPDLLPKQYEKFWTYPGSLSWRPYTENAIWIVLRNPIEFSKKELFAFRNFRPSNRRRLQPLNDRVVRSSFHKLGKLGNNW